MPTIAVDFDGTLVTEKSGVLVAIPGAPQAMEKLKEMGFEIIINTCRITMAESRGQLPGEIRFLTETLNELGIPFDSINLLSKPIADYYVDDRAVPFRGNWTEILLELQENPKKS